MWWWGGGGQGGPSGGSAAAGGQREGQAGETLDPSEVPGGLSCWGVDGGGGAHVECTIFNLGEDGMAR